METTVVVTFGEILNAPAIGAWDHMCEKYGINIWCLNEGLADSDDEITITLKDAKRYGLIKEETY